MGADKSPVLYLLSTLSVRMKTLRYLQHSLEGAAPLISCMHPRDSAGVGGRTYVTSLLSIDIIIEEIELAMLLNTSLKEKRHIYIYIRDCLVLWTLDKCSSRCKRQLDVNLEEDCIFYYSSKIHKFVMKAHLLCLFYFCAFATKSSKMRRVVSPCVSVLDPAVTVGVALK